MRSRRSLPDCQLELRVYEMADVGLTEVNNELDNLHDGDILLPPDTDASGALKVVPVHDDMDHQVQDDWYP
jgi:hypothetical protein